MTDRVGLDTNIALRWVADGLGKDSQSDRAYDAMAALGGPFHLNLIVLAEMVWLVSQGMKFDRAAQAGLILGLLENPSVELADREAVKSALTAFEHGEAGFTDHLIGALNNKAGCATTLTFDKIAAKSPDFTLLT